MLAHFTHPWVTEPALSGKLALERLGLRFVFWGRSDLHDMLLFSLLVTLTKRTWGKKG